MHEARRALAVGAAGFVLVGFNGTATNIAFDDITASFPTVAQTTTAFVASGYLVGTAAFLPLAGRIADRHGRVRTFQAAMVLFAATAALSAVASSVWLLIGARVLQSIAGALVIPASLAMVLPLVAEARRSAAVTTWAAAGPVSAAIAPSTSAAILEVANWRVLFLVSAPAAVAIWFVGQRVLREVPMVQPAERLDAVGAGIGTAAIAVIVLVVGKGGEWGWTSPLALACLVLIVAAVPMFLRQSRRHPEPLIDLSLFGIRQVWVANLANGLVSITSLSIWLVWPLFLQRIWGYSSFEVGLALTPGPITAALTSVAGGRIADRHGHRGPIVVGCIIMVAAVAWCLLALQPGGSYVTDFLPGIVCFGFGWGLSSPTMNSFALDAVPEPQWGAMNASFNMLRNVGGAVGVAAAVAVLGDPNRSDLADAFERAFLFFLVCTTAAAVVLIAAYPRQHRRTEHAAVATG